MMVFANVRLASASVRRHLGRSVWHTAPGLPQVRPTHRYGIARCPRSRPFACPTVGGGWVKLFLWATSGPSSASGSCATTISASLGTRESLSTPPSSWLTLPSSLGRWWPRWAAPSTRSWSSIRLLSIAQATKDTHRMRTTCSSIRCGGKASEFARETRSWRRRVGHTCTSAAPGRPTATIVQVSYSLIQTNMVEVSWSFSTRGAKRSPATR
mmetsp:Transcript_36577/g.87418  ORF Transcript_36577/g.87418 Transcript_36577/m.87418 type:complete len:212 (+) Transcript_36577:486-1121(+)